MNPTFVPGYSIQGFGVPRTKPNLQPEIMDVEVDITEASLAHGHALITEVLSVTASMRNKRDPSVTRPDLRAKHPLSAEDMSVTAELEGTFEYLVHLSIDVNAMVRMLNPDAAPLRLLIGCMSYELEARPTKMVLDNNHTAFDIIGGAGTCHYGDTKC